MENSGGRVETVLFACVLGFPQLLALKSQKGNAKMLWKFWNCIPQVEGSLSCS